MPIADSLQAFTSESITVDNTSGGIRLTISNVISTPPAKSALITVEDAQIRWFDDGTAPTASAGHIGNVNDVISLNNASRLWNFRAIRTGSTSGTIRVSYFR